MKEAEGLLEDAVRIKKWQNQQVEFKRDGDHLYQLITIGILGEPIIFLQKKQTNKQTWIIIDFSFL